MTAIIRITRSGPARPSGDAAAEARGACRRRPASGAGRRGAASCSESALTAPHPLSVAELRAGDGADDVLVARAADVERRHAAAEAQHDDAVRHVEDVREVVTDDDDAEPALAQPADQVQHLLRLGDAECRGGLVEQDDAGLAEQRPGDRHGLALAARERGDVGAHVADGRDRERVEQLDRALLHLGLVDLAR